MKKLFVLSAVLGLSGIACANQPSQVEAQPVVEITSTTTATSPAPTSTTTTSTVPACVPSDTTAERTYLDTVEASISQTEGAIASIRLIIDDGTRDRAAAVRYQATVQTDYQRAFNAFTLAPLDRNKEELAYQEGRLASAKDRVASWDALLTKARGDLTRAQAQKTSFERKATEARTAIKTASCL